MSYCRFNGIDSDVYVYASYVKGRECWICCGCNFAEKPNETVFRTHQAMITHLKKHVFAGDKVPQHAFDRLERERLESL